MWFLIAIVLWLLGLVCILLNETTTKELRLLSYLATAFLHAAYIVFGFALGRL